MKLKFNSHQLFLLGIILIVSLFNSNGFAQTGGDPCDPKPFCSSNTYTFPNSYGGTDVTSDFPNTDFGCLGYSPNGIWYYMQVDQAGNIKIKIKQGTGVNATGSGLDVDFAMWGPFTDLSTACTNISNGTAGCIQSSYSTDATETVGIGVAGGDQGFFGCGGSTPAAAQVGQIYVVCITNYEDDPGYISFQQTNVGASGAGGVSCAIVNPVCSISAITGTTACNSGGSTFNYSGTVTFTAAPTTGTLTISSSCGGTNAVLNAPFTSPANFTISNIPGGSGNCDITATFSDLSTCTKTISITKPNCCTPPATPTITTASATCSAQGSATMTNYSSANTYTFTPSGPTVGTGGSISGMTVGTSYTVTASVGAGCFSPASTAFSIQAQLPTPSTPTITTASATCSAQGSATMTNYSSSNTYTFTPSGPTVGTGGSISGMTATVSYTVVAIAGGCSSVASTPFNIQPILAAMPTPVIDTVSATCTNAGSANINGYVATNTYTFSPSGPTVGSGGVINGLIFGTNYTVTASDGSCTSNPSSPFSIQDKFATLPAPVTTVVTPTCVDAGTATINGYNSSNSYVFTPSGPTIGSSGLISGMSFGTGYTVTVSDGICTSLPSASFSIQDKLSTLPAPIIDTTNSTCTSNGTAIISGYNSTITYTFTPVGPTIGSGGVINDMTPSVNYSVVATSGICVSDPSNPFVIAPQLSSTNTDFLADVTAGCKPLNVKFTSSSDSTFVFQWNFGDGQTSNEKSPSHIFSNTGCYDVSLTLTNNFGCISQVVKPSYVCVVPNPIASFTPSTYTISNVDGQVSFTNTSTGAITYSWDFGDNSAVSTIVNPSHTYDTDNSSNYAVTLIAVSDMGCVDSVQAIIKTKSDIIFYVPNAFTPDGDEYNNKFIPILAEGLDANNYELLIYDRWGELIFESHDVNYGWDGTYLPTGKICPDGVYTWKISLKTTTLDNRFSRSGHVTLVR